MPDQATATVSVEGGPEADLDSLIETAVESARETGNDAAKSLANLKNERMAREAKKYRVFLAGVPFMKRITSANLVVLNHPSWPLVGSGQTEIEAKTDLKGEIAKLAPQFSRMSPTLFSGEGRKYRAFVLAYAKVIDLAGETEG